MIDRVAWKCRTAPALAVLAALAVTATAIAPAEAARRRNAEVQREAPAPTLSGPAVLAVVSIAAQRVSVYDANGGVMRASISSGQTGYETPVGVFSVLQKEVEHYSNLYDDASMPYMQRITWSGVALHAGALPGYPASHGCVRLPHSFAEQIFGVTSRGLRVVVSRDDVSPIPFDHPALFQPQPLAQTAAVATQTAYRPGDPDGDIHPLTPDVQRWPARQALLDSLKPSATQKATEAQAAAAAAEPLKAALKQKTAEHKKVLKSLRSAEAVKKDADEDLARAEKRLAGAQSPRTQKAAAEAKEKAAQRVAKAETQLAEAQAKAQPAIEEVARLTEQANAAEAASTAAGNAAKEAERRMLPASVFVSRKTQRLYIRQGNEPVLDVPVTIRNPDRPIGTHVFTAMAYDDTANAMRWNAVSVIHGGSGVDYTERNSRRWDDDDDWDDGWNRKRRRNVERNTTVTPTNVKAAADALDRITVPPEVQARLSEYVWPGSSFIVSDEEASKETGKATDFILVMSDEPQGALKKRRRGAPPDDFYGYYGYGYGYERPRRSYRGPKPFFWW